MAGDERFELPPAESKSAVLPLHMLIPNMADDERFELSHGFIRLTVFKTVALPLG